MTVRPIEILNQKPHRSPPPRMRSPGSTSGWPKARSATAGSRGPISPTPAPVCGSTASSSTSKIWFSTTPAWTSAAPTHELTRAHAVLRARRRIAEAKPDWALSAAGLAGLRGRGGQGDREEGRTTGRKARDGSGATMRTRTRTRRISMGRSASSRPTPSSPPPSPRSTPRTPRRSARSPARPGRRPERDPLVYDPDWDEDGRLDHWRTVVDQTRSLPPTLAAAIAADAWDAIEPLEHTPWLGRLLAASAVARTRQNPLASAVPACRAEDHPARAPAAARRRGAARRAARGDDGRRRGRPQGPRSLADDQRTLLARKLDGRRATSKLPALLDYVLTRPIVSAGMIAAELKITPRAAQNLVAELGLREATGRGRYRAWGIL